MFLKSINATWDRPDIALMTACNIMEKTFFDDDIDDLRRHLSEAAKRIDMQNSRPCVHAASKLLDQESMSNAKDMHSPAEEVVAEFLRSGLSDRDDEAPFQIHALISISSNLYLENTDEMITLFSYVAKQRGVSNKSWFAPLLYSMEKRQQHVIVQVV
ncbi:hypothetical protein COB18_03430 [Candidatus Kaiserbacteria bacterium]|nr:MAG: hypothetical protein COB18_03430 [Candidatus Kaiserbacteria bacterium]